MDQSVKIAPTPPETGGPGSGGPATGTLAAIGLVVAASACFAALDTIAKGLTADYHAVQIAWARYLFATLIVFPMLIGPNRRLVIVSARPGLQLVRAGLLVGVTGLFFGALTYLPLATMTSLSFTSILILTVLAHFVLKEQVRLRRWTAVGVGFVGVLLIVRPGSDAMHWASFAAILCAVFSAFYHLLTRVLAAVDRPETTYFYSAILGPVCLSAVVPLVWNAPDMTGWLLMAIGGLLGGFGHLALIRAYTLAPASAIAPFQYVTLVFTTASGYWLFGDVPDLWTVAGSALIVASGLYVFYREAKLRRQG